MEDGNTLHPMCKIALWVAWCHVHITTKLTVTTKLLVHTVDIYYTKTLG